MKIKLNDNLETELMFSSLQCS